MTAKPWQNRIVAHGEEAPDQLLANPLNFRVHPEKQQRWLKSSLDQLGTIAEVIVNRTTGHLIDGHARVTLAMRIGQPTIPVAYVELTPAEEKRALAVLDRITVMAAEDKDVLAALVHEIDIDPGEDLAEVIKEMAQDAEVPGFEPVGAETQPRLDELNKVTCPECGHEFHPEK